MARIEVDKLPPPDRTPTEMLEVLRKIVNRKVECLDAMTEHGAVDLPLEWNEELDDTLDRVLKLVRGARQDVVDPSKLTDSELLGMLGQR